jgi:hypothetical protein
VAGENAKKFHETRIGELEALSKDTDIGKLEKEWKDKIEKAEKKALREADLKADVAKQFEDYKLQVTSTQKADKIDRRYEKAFQAVRPKENIRESQKRGFKDIVFESVILDFDEAGNELLLDRKTNEPIKNPAKADAYLTLDDFVLQKAIDEDIVIKNVHGNGGDKNHQRRTQETIEPENDEQKEKLKNVNPAFLGA